MSLVDVVWVMESRSSFDETLCVAKIKLIIKNPV